MNFDLREDLGLKFVELMQEGTLTPFAFGCCDLHRTNADHEHVKNQVMQRIFNTKR